MTFQNSTYLLSSTYILILEAFDMFMTILYLHCTENQWKKVLFYLFEMKSILHISVQ